MGPHSNLAAGLLLLLAAALAACPALALPEQQASPSPSPSSSPAPTATNTSGSAQVHFPEAILPNATADMACKLDGVSPYFTIHVAALNLREHPGACGRCVQLACSDPGTCNGPYKSVTVAVVEHCPDCGSTGIKINPFAFRELSGQNQHELPSFPVTWAFAPCDSYGVIFDDDGDIARQPTLPPALPPPTGVTSFDAATGSGGAPAPAAEALAPAAAQPQAGDFTGAATLGHTQEPLIADAARQLACGFGHVGTNAQFHFVGVNLEQHAAGLACGRCIQVAPSSSSGQAVVAHVVDSCWGCPAEDILVSPTLFRTLGGNVSNGQQTRVSWSFVPCGQTIEGSIYMDAMPGGNEWYQQLTFANAARPLQSVSANGQPLAFTGYYRWVWWAEGNPLNMTNPIRLRLTSQDGAIAEASLPSMDSQFVGAQFLGAAG